MSARRGFAGPSRARSVAYETVRRTFERGEFTDRTFRNLAVDLEGRDRGLAQRLAYGAVQRRGTLDAVIGRLANRSPTGLDPPVVAALRLGLYEVLYSETATHAAVNEAVELARFGGARRGGRSLVNAVMRRAAREHVAILDSIAADDTPERAATAHSVPRWLAELWWSELGAEAALSLLRSVNRPAERALRVNTMRWSPQDARAELGLAGVHTAWPAPVGSVELPEILSVNGPWGDISSWVERGLVVPQSRGSAAAVAILDPQPGESILELCAGPGTKTGQIAARMSGEGEIVAVELDAARGREVSEQMTRLGFDPCVEVVIGDAAALDLGGHRFDRVLVDAPCSDLGALDSRPDVRWRKSPGGIERLAELQAAILERAVAHLSPAGVLVYSTCTISSRENEDVVTRMASDAESIELEALGRSHGELASPADERFLQIRPDRDATTGFFIARGVYCPATDR